MYVRGEITMNLDKLKETWLSEEKMPFSGWDFSYITSRISDDSLPWDYRTMVLSYMNNTTTMLDMGTGGGEFLLSLNPPKGRTFATEAYPANFELCKQILPDQGIDVRQVFNDNELPYESCSFDLIINQHSSFSSHEVFRLLKPGGLFVTQQVGGQNNRELSKLLLGQDSRVTDPNFNLQSTHNDLLDAGFILNDGEESFPIRKFYDVGALVYYARIIEWEFPEFSVEKCFKQLCLLQEKITEVGFIQTVGHRFLVVGRK
jgi:SAM-dependent methyltransferase